MCRYPYPVEVPLNMAGYSGLSERPPPWRLPVRPSPQKRLSRQLRRPGSDRPDRGRRRPSRCRCGADVEDAAGAGLQVIERGHERFQVFGRVGSDAFVPADRDRVEEPPHGAAEEPPAPGQLGDRRVDYSAGRSHQRAGTAMGTGLRHQASPRFTPSAQTTAGFRAMVSSRTSEKPAWATAIRPPLRSRRRSSSRRATGSRQNIVALTARILSNGSSKAGRSSGTEPSRRSTTPRLRPSALSLFARRTISSEWSIPHTYPFHARRPSSLIARPGPKPISSTRSSGRTSSRDTAHAFRLRFEVRWAMSRPATRPQKPVGCPNWARMAAVTLCLNSTGLTPLLPPQGFDGFQPCRTVGRQDPEDEPHQRRHPEGQPDGRTGHRGGDDRVDLGQQCRDPDAEADACEPADQGQEQRLEEKLKQHVGVRCSDHLADPDLPGAFGDGDEHDVHDPDAADQQGDASNATEEDGEEIRDQGEDRE